MIYNYRVGWRRMWKKENRMFWWYGRFGKIVFRFERSVCVCVKIKIVMYKFWLLSYIILWMCRSIMLGCFYYRLYKERMG